jgi:hypothetical protein
MPVIGGAASRTGTRPVGEGELLFNVRDYGAAGDGTTDDRAAVIAAHTALVAAGGGVLYFPPGTYLLSNGYTFTASNITLAGTAASTIKIATNAAVPLLQFSNVSNVKVRDLVLDFGSQTYATASLQFDGTTTAVTVDSVRFKNAKRALVFAPSSADVVSVVRVRDCEFDSTTSLGAIAGGFTGGGSTLTDVKVTGCHVKNVTGTAGNHAFAFYYASNIKIIGNTVDDTVDTACGIFACTDVKIGGNTLWQQHIGVYAGNGSHQVSVYGNDIKSATDMGIAFFDAGGFGPSTELNATGNNVHDCPATGICASDVNSPTITGNTVARCGQNTALAGTQRTGITVQINTGGANRGCKDVVVTGNNVFDDAGSPKMQYSIVIQTPVNGLTVANNNCRGATTTNVLWVNSGGGITVTGSYNVETDAGTFTSNPTSATLATPTATYGTGAGTSPPSIAIAGKDTAGIIFFGTGTTPAATGNIVFSVTFAKPFTSAPRVLGMGNNGAALGLGLYVDTGSVTTTGFNVYATTTLPASHALTYEFGWIAVP